MTKKTARYGLGIYSDNQEVRLFYADYSFKPPVMRLDTSTNGTDFHSFCDKVEIFDKRNKPVGITKINFLRVSQLKDKYLLIYQPLAKKSGCLQTAVSHDLRHWQKFGRISKIKNGGMIVPQYQFKNQYVLYFGGNSVGLAVSRDLKKWSVINQSVLKPGEDFAGIQFQIGGLIKTPKGICLIYARFPQYSLWLALFDQQNPQNLLWSSKEPIWQMPEELMDERVAFLGTAVLKGRLFAYWQTAERDIFSVSLMTVKQLLQKPTSFPALILNRIKDNPILKPILEHYWESKAVFNPAALHEEGKVHLVYRAIGDDDVSVLGYAMSRDGLHIHERLKKPIFSPKKAFRERSSPRQFYISPFMSGGGGCGGCEDPRLTRIGDTIYMTYVAYDGWSVPRVALSSIKTDDFLAHEWHWQEPVLISPPGVVDKNACLLPEKIQDKYVILHRIYPNILLDFVDDLDFDGETKWLRGDYVIGPRRSFWDSRKVGAGPPPIKTDEGWLLIYQAVGEQDPCRYKMGAMLLDLDDPARILYRSDQPILEPTAIYENEGWKSGVVYPCGAVTKEDQLLVYYGGGDTVVCAAQAKLSQFLYQLKNSGVARLKPLTFAKVIY